ncbi:hypothetical protein HPB50_022849 [Hyalomma asiaticum]|uniref:Uncharacterized protein n=1 Tax=Hyalomma asiaticum TaxID=266040 RepID=A0ACB7SNN8_HYAAI|nr:hypothetical protein HPB50_022849 [Hyalomma asiaticum]
MMASGGYALEDLRKQARHLENEIDLKLVSFSKLGTGFGSRELKNESSYKNSSSLNRRSEGYLKEHEHIKSTDDRFPLINSLVQRINLRKRRDSIILGLVIGTCTDQAKKLRLKLEGWREVVLPLNSVLLWNQPYYPACIVSAVTTVFLTSQHERQLHDICLEAVHSWQSVVSAYASLKKAKQDKPKVYVVAVLISLLVVAWIGNAFDNLLLTYLIVLFLAMTPGMKHHGIFKKYFSVTVLTIRDHIADKMKKN